MKHALTQVQYRFAVLYATLIIYLLRPFSTVTLKVHASIKKKLKRTACVLCIIYTPVSIQNMQIIFGHRVASTPFSTFLTAVDVIRVGPNCHFQIGRIQGSVGLKEDV